MRQVSLERVDLESCVSRAQRERLVVTRNGKPVALVVGVEGLDPEQVDLGSSDRFWKLIRRRRKQRTMTRSELEQKVARWQKS